MNWPDLDASPEEIARRRINRAPLPLLATGVPWATIMLASITGTAAMVASAPILPPLAFMMLLAWRMLRPGMLPVWAGLPLGLFDDLYSGQPFGSGIVLWSVAMLAMEAIDERFLWRSFAQDWLVAGNLIAGYLLISAMIAGLDAGAALPLVIVPQLLVSVAVYPVLIGVVALFDRLRLLPLKRL
ncbi:Rod shape-determining protein MreD [Novosphingobium lubricantis]